MRPDTPDTPAVCPLCAGRGRVLARDGRWYPCACGAGRARRHELVLSSLDSVPGDPDADGWYVPVARPLGDLSPNGGQAAAYAAVTRFAATLAPCLLLLGDFGTGKSRLMLGAALALCDHSDPRVQPRYVHAAALADHLKEGIKDDSVAARVRAFVAAPILFVDDLGAHHATEYVGQKMLQILDGRYERRLPTVVGTNETLDALGARMADRFMDREVYACFVLRGSSIREDGLTHRMARWEGGQPVGGEVTDYHRRRGRAVICTSCDCRPCRCASYGLTPPVVDAAPSVAVTSGGRR